MQYLIFLFSFISAMPVYYSTGKPAMPFSETTGELKAAETDSLNYLVNGWLYQYQTVQNGHPYFGDQGWISGTVTTNYESFKNVLVKYDIYQDELIIPLYRKEGTYTIVINPGTLKSFTIKNHHFINLNYLISDCDNTYPGYYEVIYDGNLKLVSKWQKQTTDTDKISGGSFKIGRTMYLIRHNKLNPIKSKTSLLKLFPENKTQIRKYIREKQIYLNRSGDTQIRDLIEYIDQLYE